jgi:hypothetical protein
MSIRSLFLVATLSLIAAPSAFALTLDFEDVGFGHGTVITSSKGVSIATTNVGGGPNLGVTFDTNLLGTQDSDLQRISPGLSGGEAGWRSGNLAPSTDLGNILIIQERTEGCDTGTCRDPDDEGSRPAGHFDFDFSSLGTFDRFSFDLVDVDDATAEMGSVEFFLGAVSQGLVGFESFLSDASVVYGDNSANHIDESFFGNSTPFDRVRISMGGSGGIDNLVVNPVPEPNSALLYAVGFGVAAVARRKR